MSDHLLGAGVFEITDHTTASDWERFIANIEDVLIDWNLTKQSCEKSNYCELPKGFISSGLWHEKHDIIRFGNVSFDLRYQYLDDTSLKLKSLKIDNEANENDSNSSGSDEFRDAENEEELNIQVSKEKERVHGEHELPEDMPHCLKDLTAASNDFASKAHCLVRWYNLRRFMILSIRGNTIITEDQVKLVLSSSSIALTNVDCQVPIFIQIHNPKSNFYQGISEHYNIRTLYEMVFYKRSLKQHSYLSSLVALFREKVNCDLTDPISVTIRLNYCLSSFDLFKESHEQFSLEAKGQAKSSVSQEKSLKIEQDMRSDATFEKVVEAMNFCVPHSHEILKYLHVAALWPPLSDKVVTDSQVHSDLDPTEAPIWTIRCLTSDNCNMKLVHETQVIYDLLRESIDYAFDKLDGNEIFKEVTRDDLRSKCLRLSYDIARQPEVVLSNDLRKLVALMFYRATELYGEMEPLDELAGQLKKEKSSLNEVYKNFRKQKPSIKEFIIRTQISRPFSPTSSPALPQQMFCSICDEEFRLCGAFSELCN